jgi:hypothetical protein
MFQLSDSALSPDRSAITWIWRMLIAVGAGLAFVDYRNIGLPLIKLGAMLSLSSKLLQKKIPALSVSAAQKEARR